MEVNFALFHNSPLGNNMSRERLLGRMLLSRVVPGLEGTAVPSPEVTTQIFMVQITTAGGPVTPGKPTQRHLVVVGSNSSQSIVTTSGSTFLLRPGPSGITVAATARSITAPPTNSSPRPATPTTIRLTSPATSIRPSLSPIVMSPSSSPIRGAAPNKKIQYICKQGNQTFVVDYPMSPAVLEKMRAGGGGLQLRLPVGALRPVSLPETITSQAASASSVNPNMPKFQFAFGQSPTPSPAPEDKTKSVPASPSSSCSSVTVPEHGREDEGLAGRLGSLLESAGIASTAASTSAGEVRVTASVPTTPRSTSSPQVKQLPSQAVLVSAGLTTVQEKKPEEVCVKQEVGAAVITSNATQGPADLIRQLNLARAQGLVVLQQWGDKQVLVHKATGRWIMRQGSRLVTVPPQALGITSTDGGTNSTSSSPGPAISSRTMEQLAEFDSILESKFKTESGEPMANGGVVVVSGAGNTRQVIQLPTTPLKKELVLTKEGQQLGLKGSPVKSPLLPPAAAFPKPQEDPETMKRIQAILDDYNDQIRNSPDLHNRPAPRRRTNGSGSPESPKGMDSPPSSSPTSGASSPSTVTMQCDGSPSPNLSPTKDPLTVAMAEIKESGALTLSTQPAQSPVPQVTSARLIPKTGGNMGGLARGLVVQAGQSGGMQRVMVVQKSGDGRTIMAVRPVIVSTNNIVTSSTSTWSPTYITVNTSSSSSTSSIPITVSLPTRPVSPSELPTTSSSPPRPSTPGLGIPMEMTPGQIMEAEISATLMDTPSSPYTCPSMPDNVFSAGSPGPTVSSCPGLASDFDQVVSTSGVQPPAPLPSPVEPPLASLDLPLSPAPSPATQTPAVSLAPSTVKRRRSGRGQEQATAPPPKRTRLGTKHSEEEEVWARAGAGHCSSSKAHAARHRGGEGRGGVGFPQLKPF